MDNINTFITVGAIFKSGKINPKWFVWENRQYKIKTINYSWEDSQGLERVINFAVSDEANTYELAYNTKRTIWQLSKIN